MASSLSIVFFGTPAFAVPSLEALLASPHQVRGVVTQPDKPRGRGQKTVDAPVKLRARAAGVPVLQPPSMKDPAFLEQLATLGAELGVVAAYGKILTDAVLNTTPRGMINVHASLLPRHRGAAPVHRAVIAGDTETGVTIMRVVKALDAGPTLAAVSRKIAIDETSADVEHDLARLGAALLVATIDELSRGTATETPQDDSLATYASRITKEDGLIEWSRAATDIHNLIRGLHPWPHAYSYWNGSRVILLRSRALPDSVDLPPGRIAVARGGELGIATGGGTLHILELQLEGGRPMDARGFLAGHPVGTGDRFTSAP